MKVSERNRARKRKEGLFLMENGSGFLEGERAGKKGRRKRHASEKLTILLGKTTTVERRSKSTPIRWILLYTFGLILVSHYSSSVRQRDAPSFVNLVI